MTFTDEKAVFTRIAKEEWSGWVRKHFKCIWYKDIKYKAK
jgi:hypothetical protein